MAARRAARREFTVGGVEVEVVDGEVGEGELDG